MPLHKSKCSSTFFELFASRADLNFSFTFCLFQCNLGLPGGLDEAELFCFKMQCFIKLHSDIKMTRKVIFHREACLLDGGLGSLRCMPDRAVVEWRSIYLLLNEWRGMKRGRVESMRLRLINSDLIIAWHRVERTGTPRRRSVRRNHARLIAPSLRRISAAAHAQVGSVWDGRTTNHAPCVGLPDNGCCVCFQKQRMMHLPGHAASLTSTRCFKLRENKNQGQQASPSIQKKVLLSRWCVSATQWEHKMLFWILAHTVCEKSGSTIVVVQGGGRGVCLTSDLPGRDPRSSSPTLTQDRGGGVTATLIGVNSFRLATRCRTDQFVQS